MLFFFLMLLRFDINTKKKTDIIFYTLLFFNVLRYDVGWDYTTYISEINMGINELINSRYEPLSKLIFLASAVLDFYPLTFIIFGCLQLYLLRKIVDELAYDKPVALIFYLLLPLFFLGFLSTIRQGVANNLVFASYLALRKDKITTFLLLIFVAICFQKSAAFGLFYLFLYKKVLPNYVNWSLFILSFFCSAIFKEYISTLNIQGLSYYIENEVVTKTSSLNYFYYAINVFILLNYNNFYKADKENAIYIQMANFGIFLFNAFIFEPVTSCRVSQFYISFWILIFATLPKINKLYSYRIINILPFAFVFLYYLYTYVNAYNIGILKKVSFIPYKFWLFNL